MFALLSSAYTEEGLHGYSTDRILSRAWIGGRYEVARGEKSRFEQIFGLRSKAIGVMLLTASKNSPVDESDLLRGDILISLNDQKIKSVNSLYRLLWENEPKDEIKIEYLRDGEKFEKILKTKTEKYIREKFISLGINLSNNINIVPDPNYDWLISSYKSNEMIPEINDATFNINQYKSNLGNYWKFFLFPIGFGAGDLIISQG